MYELILHSGKLCVLELATLKLNPAFHYNLTRNYIFNTESVRFENGSDVGVLTSTEQPLRWFFSFTGGLSFKF